MLELPELLTSPFVPMPTRMSALPLVVMLSWPINPSAARALPTVVDLKVTSTRRLTLPEVPAATTLIVEPVTCGVTR